jgi:hypothetical protein
MTPSKWSLALLALVIGLFAATDTWAHGRGRARLSLGFHFGVPYYGWYAPPPYYYYPYPMVVSPPPVYVERYVEQAPPPADVTGPQPAAPNYWYYCRESQAYFPYVKECPGAWQRVVPEAPRQ